MVARAKEVQPVAAEAEVVMAPVVAVPVAVMEEGKQKLASLIRQLFYNLCQYILLAYLRTS